MTFANLEINPELMRELYPDVFSAEYTDAALKALKKQIAKDTLKNDLVIAFRLQPTESAELDNIADKYSDLLATALMYLQCYFYFVEVDDVDNKNALRKRECLMAYSNLKSGFGDMFTEQAESSVLGTITRG
jgi:hypothetical protein